MLVGDKVTVMADTTNSGKLTRHEGIIIDMSDTILEDTGTDIKLKFNNGIKQWFSPSEYSHSNK